MAAGRVSALRRWALRNLIVADGPRAGRPFRIASPPWAEVLDSMDRPDVAQVTIRGSVQSGKTASLIAAGLGHMAAGRSVLIFEPDDRLKRALAARILAWGRLCKDDMIREAYEPKRPPFARTTDTGRLEVISAREAGAGVMRTAEVVIVDELRLFHLDLLADLIDRMAAYGGRGRLITASSAGYQDECRTTHELEKSDSRHWFLKCPSCRNSSIAAWRNVRYANRRYPVYIMPCCAAPLEGVPFRRAMQAGQWRPTKEPMVPGVVGYHLDSFLSPFETLRTITRQWRRADAHRKQTGSMAEVISFQTGRLALPFKPADASGVTPEGLRRSCREAYDPGIVPAGAAVLVGACDVQDDRLEAEISAWGVVEVKRPDDASRLKGWGSHEFRGLAHEGRWYRLRRWALEYRRFHGDPGATEIWEQLAEFMESPRPHATGPMLRPVAVGIDTGGHYGPQVADFCKVRGRGYQPLKGLPPQRYGAVLARRSVTADSLESYGPEGLMLVCGNAGKASCFSLMRQSIAGVEPKPMVWPMDESKYGPEEFEGIVSETLMRTLDKRTGATRLMWRKIARANEPLDVLVYSLALVSHLGLGFMLAEADAIASAAGRKEAA